MVIGNGMLAKRFDAYRKNEQYVIFASGVSNSKTKDEASYAREEILLKATISENRNRTLVYFSTCSIYDPQEKHSFYVAHKTRMENMILESKIPSQVFRVSNIVGQAGNPNTILNFFYHHLVQGLNFDLWTGSYRNLLDVDDMYTIVDSILTGDGNYPSIINIANPESYSVEQIVHALEQVLDVKGNYIAIARGERFEIDISLIQPVIDVLEISFGEEYLPRLIKKYYDLPAGSNKAKH